MILSYYSGSTVTVCGSQIDNELTEEALKISNEINCYIPGSSQDYWDQIDIRLYKHHKDKLMKYYSMDN